MAEIKKGEFFIVGGLLNLTVYFCDPYTPWQRGSNENTNGLLRQYLPKGSDINAFSQADLNAIAAKLNTRPQVMHLLSCLLCRLFLGLNHNHFLFTCRSRRPETLPLPQWLTLSTSSTG